MTETETPTLLILRGLPASGKTTLAAKLVKAEPEKWVRVGRDFLRDQMFGTRKDLTPKQEGDVTLAETALVKTFLRAGKSVIVDNLHLKAQYARKWADLAAREGARFELFDVATPTDECVKRDAKRKPSEQVGEDFIRKTSLRFRSRPEISARSKAAAKTEMYYGTPDAPKAWIFDVDGTLSLNRSGRSFYDMTRVGEDDPNAPVIQLARALKSEGFQILVVTGRSGDAYADTADWLTTHLGDSWDELWSREEGDQRDDSVVKAEIFNREIRPFYDVQGVVDDRASVVRMWRSMGLLVAQVADGLF